MQNIFCLVANHFLFVKCVLAYVFKKLYEVFFFSVNFFKFNTDDLKLFFLLLCHLLLHFEILLN